jgi:hypothetical protein
MFGMTSTSVNLLHCGQMAPASQKPLLTPRQLQQQKQVPDIPSFQFPNTMTMNRAVFWGMTVF